MYLAKEKNKEAKKKKVNIKPHKVKKAIKIKKV
jgi:hypothetical protein